MVKINEELTRKVADLARLELSEKEVQAFTAQLGQILEYVRLLNEPDVSNIAPMTHPLDMETPMREDEVMPSPVNGEGKPRALDCAPDVVSDSFKVPPILPERR